MKKFNKKNKPFDKYDLYRKAVQSPEQDVLFYLDRYKEHFGRPKEGLTLREDFCGTGAISCEWVKLNKSFKSCGLDLDEEPMSYGRQNYISRLKTEQAHRVALIQKNVLEGPLPQADVAVAVNFSYFLFKKREVLQSYFENVHQSLHHRGLYVLDIFGGSQCLDAITDKTKHKDFTYYWDQKGFDPVTNEAQFGIHFKYQNKMYKDVFKYDWRMWTIPEIREILQAAGFEKTLVYWEGTNRQGGGNGLFSPTEKGEACLSWIAYIVSVKS